MKILGLFLTLFTSCFADPILVGYYSNQAQYRPGAGSCMPGSLSAIAGRLDVLNYAYLPVNYQSAVKPAGPTNDFHIHFAEWNDEELLKELRQKNPTLKIVVSVKNLSLNDPEKCSSFISSLFDLTDRLQLQGVDISGDNLLFLLQALKTAVAARGQPFIVTVAASKTTPEELLTYAPFVDWFNILEISGQEDLVNCYLKIGIPKEKLVMGVASSGACSTSLSGYYTKKPGFLAYYEIIDGLESGLFSETSLVYTRPETAFQKGRLVQELQLKGACLTNLDTDNFMDPLSPYAITEALKEGMTP